MSEFTKKQHRKECISYEYTNETYTGGIMQINDKHCCIIKFERMNTYGNVINTFFGFWNGEAYKVFIDKNLQNFKGIFKYLTDIK